MTLPKGFQFFKSEKPWDAHAPWFWRLWAPNGSVFAESVSGFTRRPAAVRGAKAAARLVARYVEEIR